MKNFKQRSPSTIKSELQTILETKIPTHYLPKDWEGKIQNLLPKFNSKYQDLLLELLNEVQTIYQKEMCRINLQSTLTFEENEDEKASKIDEINQTFENPVYIKNQQRLKKNYFLSHKLVRFIIKTYSNLPSVLIDLKIYNSTEPFTLTEVTRKVKKDIKRAGLNILKNFYLKIVDYMKGLNELKTMDSFRLRSLLHCATVVLSQLIANSMMETIECLIETIRNPKNYPRMKIVLVYDSSEDSRIFLQPRLTEIFSFYHSIVDETVSISQDLVPLEYWMKLEKDGFIKIQPPDWFLQNSHLKLQQVLETSFLSLKDHREFINLQFSGIETVTENEFCELKTEDEFYVRCENVEILNEYYCQAKSLIDFVYFEVSPLDQTKASLNLQNYLSRKINCLLNSLVLYHKSIVLGIRKEFEIIESRASDIPDETKPLFELCEYLSYASKVKLKELEERIRSSIKMLSSLLQVTAISEDHMELNGLIISKLSSMDQVFLQSNNLCENMKSVLEDELQRKVTVLNQKIDQVIPELDILDDMDDLNRVEEYIEFLEILLKKVTSLETEISDMNFEEKLFKFPETAFPKVIEIKDILGPFDSLVRLICNWKRDHSIWMKGPFENLKSDEIERKTSHYNDEVSQINSTFKVKIKTEMVLSKAFKFSGIVDDSDPMQHPAPLKLCWQALRDIGQFQKNVPLAICMCNKSLAKRHWDEMSLLAGFDLTPNARTTLESMVELNLFKDLEKFEVISVSASKELELELRLRKMMEEWKGISFDFENDGKDIYFKFYDEIDSILENQTTEVEMMKCSNFVYHVGNEVETFCWALNNLRFCLNELPVVYQKFYFARRLFSNEILVSELKNCEEKFQKLAKCFEEIENHIRSDSNFCLFENKILLSEIEDASALLKEVDNFVIIFFDSLRMKFSRFFFVSNEDLISILNPSDFEFQKSFEKCFLDLNVKFNDELKIVSAFDRMGDEIFFDAKIETSTFPIQWLLSFERELFKSIIKSSSNSIELFRNQTFYSSNILNWIEKTLGMTILSTWKINWTEELRKIIFQTPSKPDWKTELRQQKTELKNDLIKSKKTILKNRTRMILTNLIMNIIYEETILKNLTDTAASDFIWETQLKYNFYNEKIKISTIKMSFDYGFEFHSIKKPGIVVTPLTERCFHSLLIAYKNQLSGSVVGPAGVGKLETITSLARAVAVLFHVFDCKTISAGFLNQILQGLISLRPWLCLDNFCYLKLEEMAPIISQTLLKTTKQDEKKIIIDGRVVKMNKVGFLCATMSPKGVEKLASVNELKRHFRTVSIMKPNTNLIVEIYLTSMGFVGGKILATKLITILENFESQKANKFNYNFSNLKTVMKIVEVACDEKLAQPDLDENVILLSAIRDVCIPELLGDELKLFQSLIRDSFSDLESQFSNSALLELLEKLCREKSYFLTEPFKLKIVQFFETLQLERDLIIVGDALTGKTTILQKVLELFSIPETQASLNMNSNIKLLTINQNAIDQNKFCDFLVGSNWEKLIQPDGMWNWVVFDGDLSGHFHELVQILLNPKSSITGLENNSKNQLIFETSNLNFASPSFISKCSIIHLEKLERLSIINSDIKIKFPNHETLISTLFNWSTVSCLTFLAETGSTIFPTTDDHLIISAWNLFQTFLNQAFKTNETEKEIKKDQIVSWCQASLVLSTVHGLGGFLKQSSQSLFDSFCISLWTGQVARFPYPAKIKPFENLTLNCDQLRDYFYIFKGNGTWKYFGDTLKGETILENNLFFKDPFVPTTDSAKLSCILQSHIKNNQPFILCSEVPSGKSCFLKYFFENKLEPDWKVNFYQSSKMSAGTFQKFILSKMVKTNFNRYQGKNLVNFIDDLYLEDELNPMLELVRQHMDHQKWFDPDKFFPVFLPETMFCAALTRGRKMCQRFLHHFHVYSFHPPSKDNMFRIFSNVLLLYYRKNLFAADVLPNVNNIVNASLSIFEDILRCLKPVPNKLHYRFDFRDLLRIIRGCGLVQKDSVESKVTFVRIFVHETYQVFGDKITEDCDKQWIFSKLKQLVKSIFKESFESVFDHLPKEGEEITKDSLNQLLFGNFLDDGKKYEEIPCLSVGKTKISQLLDLYNESRDEKLDLTLTNYFLIQLIKVCRILTIPEESLVWISSHGVGRRSISQLAAFITGQKFVEMAVSSAFNLKDWQKDLKDLLVTCGSTEKSVTFLVKDFQLKEDHMRDISVLVKSGQVPNLFSQIEWQLIVRSVRLASQAGNRNLELPIDLVKEYFTSQCKRKLHFILCLNRHDQKYLKHFYQSYPNITSCFHVCWWESWPEEALEQVGFSFIKDLKLNDETKNLSLKACSHLYNYLKTENSTCFYVPVPTDYFNMTKLFATNYTFFFQTTSQKRTNYKIGLKKLDQTSSRVQEMKSKLTELRQELEISSGETEAFMKEIEKDNASIERTTVLVKADEEVENKKAMVASVLKSECEADLAVAIPILEDAIAALNTLKPTDITLVKAMKNPPDTIKLVMAAVCVMLEVPPDRIVDPSSGKKVMDYWGPSKRVLGDMNFLQILKDYDKDNISAAVMQNIQQVYMTDPSFQPKIVAKASSAAEGLCKWVRAMVSYDKVAKVVTPKKEKLAIANNECELAESYLNEKRKMLEQLNSKLSVLKNTLKIAQGKKEQLEDEVVSWSDQLDKAEKLVSSLVNEKERWIKTGDRLQNLLDNIVGNVILGTGLITFLGPFKWEQRNDILELSKDFVGKLGLTCSSLDVVQIMKLGFEYQIKGLPLIRFFIEDALVVEKSSKYAYFLIDPEQLAEKWIREKETRNRGLRIVKILDSYFLDLVQECMNTGVPILIQDVNVEEIEQISCVVSRSVYRNDEKSFVQFGNKVVSFDLNFKIYLISNVSSPPEGIEVYSKFTVVDFSLTSEALETQLLDILISREKPVLFERFKDLELQNLKNKQVIEDEERKILEILSASEDIITDGSAINTLVKTKVLFQTTLDHQMKFEKVKKEIELIMEDYKPFAIFATAFYNVIKSLSCLNHMYEFSISSFLSLYKRSLETSNRSTNFKKLLGYFKVSILKNIYTSVLRSLLKADQLVFSFLTALTVQLDSNLIKPDEANMFLDFKSKQLAATRSNPGDPWLPENCWQKLSSIKDEEFEKFVEKFEADISTWKLFYESPIEENLPDYYQNLSTFRRLTILKILRPDKIVPLIKKFISEVIGNVFYHDLTTTVSKSFQESSCLIPSLFILPNYSSPLEAVRNHAKLIGCSFEMENIYLGENQDLSYVEKKVHEARRKGSWLFLHNCQLASRWMLKKIDEFCDCLDDEYTSLEFRLWLSSTGEKLPVSLVLRSTKIGHDQPSNLQEYLARSYTEELTKESLKFNRISEHFFFLHARVCGQMKVLDWNLSYDFNSSDINIFVGWLKNQVEVENLSLDLMRYVFGKCVYGGRILDDSDMENLSSVLKDFDFQSLSENRIKVLESTQIKDHKNWIQLVQKLDDSDCSNFLELNHVTEMEKNKKELDEVSRKIIQIKTNDFSALENIIGVRLGMDNFVKCAIQFVRENLVENFNENEVRKKYPLDYQEPLNHFLRIEVRNWNNILKIIKSSLEDLEKFYNGETEQINNFDDLESNLYRNEVPWSWKIHSPMRFTERFLSDFVLEMKERLKFTKSWIDSGHPKTFLLKCLTVPSAFLVSMKLKFCRKRNLHFHEIFVDFQIGNKIEVGEDDIFLDELYLSGAQWDENSSKFCENLTTNFYQKMPRICLQIKEKSFEKEESQKNISFPLYVSSKGQNKKYSDLDGFSNFVLNLKLKTDQFESWKNSGAALYCDIK